MNTPQFVKLVSEDSDNGTTLCLSKINIEALKEYFIVTRGCLGYYHFEKGCNKR